MMLNVFLIPFLSKLYISLHHVPVTQKCLVNSQSDELNRRHIWFWKEGRQYSPKKIKQVQSGVHKIEYDLCRHGTAIAL
jgi:hypothetical protein